MAFTSLLAETTAAGSPTLEVTGTTTITADGLQGNEEIIVEILKVDGVNYKELWTHNRQIKLTSSNNTDAVVGPSDLRFVKQRTKGAVAIGYKVIV